MNVTQKKILVAIDGSDQSLNAVRYVGRVLAPQKTEAVLFHVKRKIEDSCRDMGMDIACLKWMGDIEAREIQHEKNIREFMDQARQILLDAGFTEEAVTVNIHESKVGFARDILSESRNGYSAIALGRRGLSKLGDIVLGSVAHKLIEKLAHVPVWVVGGNPQPEKILLGLDPSQGAMKAVDHVANMLGNSNFEVRLFHVVRSADVLPGGEGEWSNEAKRVIEPVFDEAKTRLIDAGFDPNRVKTSLITGVGSRAGAIVETAREGGYGSIVIGRRGISRIEEFVMGRVSNKVIQLAKDEAVWVVS